MAGRKLNYKLAASSIVEVLISMIVIMVVFGIAMMIYANVMQSSLSLKKLKADALLRQTLHDDENTANINSTTFTDGDLNVEQTVKTYDNSDNLSEIDLIAYDMNGKEITNLHKVILNKKNE